MDIVSTNEFKDLLEKIEPSLRRNIAKHILGLTEQIKSKYPNHRNKSEHLEGDVYILRVGKYRVFYSFEESTSTITLLDIKESDVLRKMVRSEEEAAAASIC